MSDWGNPEKDMILVPTSTGYRPFLLTQLLGVSARLLRSVSNFGLSPLHFITQRGPQQDGETPLDMRLDSRVIQILIADTFCDRTTFWDRRNDLLDLLRPTRAFGGGTVQELIYRKWLPAGKTEFGSDGISNGVDTFTSNYGRFITRGGLRPGDDINISGAAYTITNVPNDYTLTLATIPGAASDLQWNYRRRHATRDLYCLLERGPSFNEGPGPQPTAPTGYREALRLRAHDSAWYGDEQEETWSIASPIGDLVFDGDGAWFGPSDTTGTGTGRWLFATDSVMETINVVYWGTDPAIPTIEITGPATSVTVTNLTTGVSVSVTTSILAGQTVTIDLLALTVTNNIGTNLLPYTSGDLSLFKLEGEPQAPDRINSVFVNAAGADPAVTAVKLKWLNRFIGI